MTDTSKFSWSAVERELARPARVDDGALARAVRAAAGSGSGAPRARRWWPAAAAAAVLAAALLGAHALNGRAGGARRGFANVEFVFVNPTARQVTLVGDFDNWNPTALPLRRHAADGVWSVVVPLARGRHVYSFVVDGSTWVPDASAPRAPEDEFGSRNSVAFVGDGT